MALLLGFYSTPEEEMGGTPKEKTTHDKKLFSSSANYKPKFELHKPKLELYKPRFELHKPKFELKIASELFNFSR